MHFKQRVYMDDRDHPECITLLNFPANPSLYYLGLYAPSISKFSRSFTVYHAVLMSFPVHQGALVHASIIDACVRHPHIHMQETDNVFYCDYDHISQILIQHISHRFEPVDARMRPTSGIPCLSTVGDVRTTDIGILYLIFIQRLDDGRILCKVGRSKNSTLVRVSKRDYPGCTILLCIGCTHQIYLEHQLILRFKSIFEHAPEYGEEYFVGDEYHMKCIMLSEFQCSGDWLHAAEQPLAIRANVLESMIIQGNARTMGVEFKIAGILRCPRYTGSNGSRMTCDEVELREWLQQALLQNISIIYQQSCPRTNRIGELYRRYRVATTITQFRDICLACEPRSNQSTYLRYLANDYLSGYVTFPDNTLA